MQYYTISGGRQESADGAAVVVEGLLRSCFFFQNPAFGPFITNDRVHRDNPRKLPGLCVKAVRSVASDVANTSLT